MQELCQCFYGTTGDEEEGERAISNTQEMTSAFGTVKRWVLNHKIILGNKAVCSFWTEAAGLLRKKKFQYGE